MYFTIRDVFQTGLPMTMISTRWNEQQTLFSDIDALGMFLDNHDNPRFLNSHILPSLYKSALAFSLTARGIAMMYYGSEQAFKGGNDPFNREEMWNSFSTTSPLYIFVQTIMKYKAKENVNASPFVEKWASKNLYVFTRGNFIVALTN